MNKSRTDIIEKVQKLLALANSDNENEAKMAAQRAQELLLKYNLTMTEVEDDGEKYTRETVETGSSRMSQEWKYIQSILVEFYFIRLIHSKKRTMTIDSKDGLKVHNEVVYSMLGQAHNVAIAKFVRDFLTRSFKDLFASYRKATSAKHTAKESFYIGLYKGLKEQLSATQTKVEQETGLVVVPDAGLDQFIDDLFNGKLSSRTPAKVNIADQNALRAGHEHGKNLKIARGLEGDSAKTQVGQQLKIAGK